MPRARKRERERGAKELPRGSEKKRDSFRAKSAGQMQLTKCKSQVRKRATWQLGRRIAYTQRVHTMANAQVQFWPGFVKWWQMTCYCVELRCSLSMCAKGAYAWYWLHSTRRLRLCLARRAQQFSPITWPALGRTWKFMVCEKEETSLYICVCAFVCVWREETSCWRQFCLQRLL